jgi:hypothetical protein
MAEYPVLAGVEMRVVILRVVKWQDKSYLGPLAGSGIESNVRI